jgi:hypothetical protein
MVGHGGENRGGWWWCSPLNRIRSAMEGGQLVKWAFYSSTPSGKARRVLASHTHTHRGTALSTCAFQRQCGQQHGVSEAWRQRLAAVCSGHGRQLRQGDVHLWFSRLSWQKGVRYSEQGEAEKGAPMHGLCAR